MSDDLLETGPVNNREQNQQDNKGTESTQASGIASGWLEFLARLGLGETVARISTGVLTVVLVGLVIWMLRPILQTNAQSWLASTSQQADVPSTVVPDINIADVPQISTRPNGVAREALIHTNIPDRPRQEIEKYTIEKGDTVIGIAKKFNLKPSTILFGNFYTLRDDPHNLSIGAELNILPLDGYYYEWQAGDGLNGVAHGLNVAPEDIINYPLNKLDKASIGNYSNPNIKPGTWLIVPGGHREYTTWSAPVGVTRTNPAIARIMGTGSCGKVMDGAVGIGSFIWPADNHFLSGYDYSEETNHRGIDISGNTGAPIYAVDSGVIVYAGWNEWGYGQMVMIDHGNGWQSLYGHMDSIKVMCGMSVTQGMVIGTIGNTGHSSGSHLHFELMHTLYSKVNPWNFLPPP